MSEFNNISDVLPPFGKEVELECNGNIFTGSLYEIVSKGLVKWLVTNEDKIQISTAVNWRFIES
jgi:hypothetical protein